MLTRNEWIKYDLQLGDVGCQFEDWTSVDCAGKNITFQIQNIFLFTYAVYHVNKNIYVNLKNIKMKVLFSTGSL